MEPAWKAQANDVLPASSRPMLGGLGRESRVRSALETLRLNDRRELVQALDEVMRPMSAREIDEALMITGVNRDDRRRMRKALKRFAVLIIAEQP